MTDHHNFEASILRRLLHDVQQMHESIKAAQQEEVDCNANIAWLKINDTKPIQSQLISYISQCETLKLHLNQLQSQHDEMLEIITARDKSRNAMLQIPKKIVESLTAETKAILQRLALKCVYNSETSELLFEFESSHLTLRYAQNTQKFKLLTIMPEPARLEEIRDYLDESNDVAGLLYTMNRIEMATRQCCS